MSSETPLQNNTLNTNLSSPNIQNQSANIVKFASENSSSVAGVFKANLAPPSYSAPDSKSILILSSTMTPPFDTEKQEAISALGFTVVVVTDLQWAMMTTQEFSTYRAIILGDPTCDRTETPVPAVVASSGVWSAAITGNIIIIGTDPTYHFRFGNNKAGAKKLIDYSIAFAAAGPTTGAYISLSCYYESATTNTPVPLLAGFGTFVVHGLGQNGAALSTGILPPQFSGLTTTDLDGWDVSIHEFFTTYPTDVFQPLAINKVTSSPYILFSTAGDRKRCEQCNPNPPDNKCDSSTGCAYTAGFGTMCACRPGFKADNIRDTDTNNQWRLPYPSESGQNHRVWVAHGVQCNTLCNTWFDSTTACNEVSVANCPHLF